MNSDGCRFFYTVLISMVLVDHCQDTKKTSNNNRNNDSIRFCGCLYSESAGGVNKRVSHSGVGRGCRHSPAHPRQKRDYRWERGILV